MNDLPADLSSADGVIVTSPGSFGSSEPQELTDFVNDGGAVYPFDQSDYDETTNFNEVADALCVVFRFNDDEVTDTENNADEDDRLLTNEFNESFAVFGDRDGLGLEAGETFEVTVTDVSDGDTCEVEFADGTTEDVFDAPRTLPNDVASGVGSDLRLNEDRVTDDTNDVDNDPELLTTSAFDSFSYPPQHLIRKYSSSVFYGYRRHERTGMSERDRTTLDRVRRFLRRRFHRILIPARSSSQLSYGCSASI